jgi:hypothetical protein
VRALIPDNGKLFLREVIFFTDVSDIQTVKVNQREGFFSFFMI